MQERNSEKLLRFLEEECRQPGLTHLFLVGDIFDLWIGDHAYFKTRYQPIIEAISRLVQGGVAVHYFEGNHDLYLQAFWATQVGVQVHEGPTLFRLGPWQVWVEHGDQIDKQDYGYRVLRRVLRSRIVRWLLTHLPSRVVSGIGERMSRASRYYTSQLKTISDERSRALLRTYAHQLREHQDYDFLVSGHLHVREVYEFTQAGRESVALNLGEWRDEQKILELNDTGFRFL